MKSVGLHCLSVWHRDGEAASVDLFDALGAGTWVSFVRFAVDMTVCMTHDAKSLVSFSIAFRPTHRALCWMI